MKDKLKTLRDMEACEQYGCCLYKHEEKLGEEAIKWIKELESYGKTDCGEGCCNYGMGSPFSVDGCPPENLTEWIKHFFNIKDSDLK